MVVDIQGILAVGIPGIAVVAGTVVDLKMQISLMYSIIAEQIL